MMLTTRCNGIVLLLMSGLVLGDTSQCKVDEAKFTWFLDDNLYYFLYSDDANLQDAQCICESLPEARLAIFDDDVKMDGVTDYLIKYHPSPQFWLDVEREAPKDEDDDEKDFTWANGCSLSKNSSLFTIGEPDRHDTVVRLRTTNGLLEYWSITPDKLYRPLCQSLKPPLPYRPTPPKLTWVSLGRLGRMFGFSKETMSLSDAKKACEQQAGEVYLATLDTHYDDVSQHILNNYPDNAFWLDADYIDTADSTFTVTWSGENNITRSYVLSSNSQDSSDSVVIYRDRNGTKLLPSAGLLSSHFICEGRPDLESTASDDSGVWVPLGSPSKQFFFSDDKKSFPEARETCAALPGYGRLANLDLMFSEVTDWILDNHSNREYWVDAARPENIDEDFQWGNGNPIDPLMWHFPTTASDFVARLRKNQGVVRLDDTARYQDSKYYVCEKEPEVTLEWRVLGSPQKLFGFSRTQSLGLQSAREACSRQLGDVTLANLDTHFDDVKQVILDNYPNDEFWVDATLPTGESDFQWGNSVGVNESMWHLDSPVLREPQARMTNNEGTVALKTWSTADKDFHFICEGQPATPLDNYANATFSSCPINTTITTESPEDTTVTTASPLAPCNFTTPSFNVSEEELMRILQSIRENLLLDKRNLSATLRKLSSADDDRPSAQTAGGFGIIFIIVVVAVIIFPDIISVVQFFDKKVHKMKNAKKTGIEKKGKDDGRDDVNDDIDDVSDIVDLDGDGGANSTNV